MQQYKGIDLFCGIGGFRLAMEENHVNCVFFSDIDKFAQETYSANFNEIPLGDITKIEAKEIPSFDILTAGFPCQPFSYAGLCQGFEDQTRGTLFFDICRIVAHHHPKMIFLENVKGLVSHKNGQTLNTILSNLRSLGYDPHWAVLSSLDFGLPQKRERWYCVAFDKPTQYEFPQPLGGNPVLRDIVEINDHANSLRLTKFETDRIKYHFEHCSEQERVQHDNSKYAPNTKKVNMVYFRIRNQMVLLGFMLGMQQRLKYRRRFMHV